MNLKYKDLIGTDYLVVQRAPFLIDFHPQVAWRHQKIFPFARSIANTVSSS